MHWQLCKSCLDSSAVLITPNPAFVLWRLEALCPSSDLDLCSGLDTSSKLHSTPKGLLYVV